MLEDFRLKVFLSVAREKSFTEAAGKLGISQPAVSQNVAELEKGLGVKLFQRLKGETILTPEGEIFKNHAEGIISSYAEVSRLFTQLPQSEIKLFISGELYSLFLAAALEDFMVIHPEVTITRSCTEDEADLKIILSPASRMPFEVNHDSIARIQIGISPAQKDMGDHKVTHESLSYYNLEYLPSASFGATTLSRLLKDFLSTSIS
mgnify:CR=1 FL=1